ncbi:MAG TPA: trigger factor [Rhodospirillales bacterium]|nr:trigger factor [Rhodospirillales bacterium]
MQVTETKSEGLLYEFNITVPADEIETVVTNRLNELKKTAKIPGFRPGKVPVQMLRKQYGPSIMGEVLERTVDETSKKAMDERELRPVVQPKIEIVKFEDGADLEYTMAIEVMPTVEPMDFSKINLERMVVKADEEEITNALDRLANAHKTSEPVAKARKSKEGDFLVIDFVGKVDGEEFAGGKAEDYSLELGSGSFIPGFEDQLTGAKVGDHVEVNVKFPEEYGAEELAGKDAIFDVDVKELREGSPAVIDDELAKKAGIDDLETLKANIREEYEREFNEMARQRMKRTLLDELEDNHEFEVPASLVENEFEGIWAQFEQHRKQAEEEGVKEDVNEGKTDDELKEDYQAIAVRRVRLGLLLAEIGRMNNIDLNQEDLSRAMMQEAQRYPGQEQMVMDYFRNNPEAMHQLRAPILEDKVVDFIFELAKVSEKNVSIEELLKEPEEAPKKKKAAKNAPAKKKAPAKKAARKDD